MSVKIIVGYRRLYSSDGCKLLKQGDLDVITKGKEFGIEVRISRKPKFSYYISSSSSLYAIPGREIPINITAYAPQEDKYMLESVIFKEVEIDDDLDLLLLSDMPKAQEDVFKIIDTDKKWFISQLDLIGGAIGLLIHRQFILQIISEAPFFLKGESIERAQFASPFVEVLEPITLTEGGEKTISWLMDSIVKSTPTKHDTSALGWLLRAWNERDPFSQFMSFFIPIEIILVGVLESEDHVKKKQLKLAQFDEIFSLSKKNKNEATYQDIKKLIMNERPSLTERFRIFAKKFNLPTCEWDIEAFSRFNRIRNGIIHNAEREFPSVIYSEGEIREVVAVLGDIAERYVALALFNTASVYNSRWRPVPKEPASSINNP